MMISIIDNDNEMIITETPTKIHREVVTNKIIVIEIDLMALEARKNILKIIDKVEIGE